MSAQGLALEAQRDTDPSMDESLLMTAAQAKALVRLLEAAPQVQRRHHFFVWMQTHVHQLLPHVLAACGAYQRQRRALAHDTFYSVPLPQTLLAALSDSGSVLMTGLTRGWTAGGGRAYTLSLANPLLPLDMAPLRDAGIGHLLVHGVARPQRIDEIESLFVLAGVEAAAGPHATDFLELLVPHLHATYLRMQSVETGMASIPKPTLQATAAAEPKAQTITGREREVLQGVREGLNNQQISQALGISPLTVKNHIQKILRKLGAHNRAQAVALTMAMTTSAAVPGVAGRPTAPAPEMALPSRPSCDSLDED